MDSITIHKNAFAKMILHCLKHLNEDCLGVLIGKFKENQYTVSNVIPLSHERILIPQLEIAFKLVILFNSD